MYISVTFPVADFRNLHRNNAGRLERPAWGQANPQAHFARGFGSIHTRTSSGSGFVGENYYADCDRLVRFPRQFFIEPVSGLKRAVLIYPFYRRFYFDGQMAGRYELGFRLNQDSLNDIRMKARDVEYIASSIARQLLEQEVRVELLDGRKLTGAFPKVTTALRDGWLLSSTKASALSEFDLEGVGSTYVGVGRPFVFIRAGTETPVAKERQMRVLLNREGTNFLITRSGLAGQTFDTSVAISERSISDETTQERLTRLFYTQVRTLAYAHSFYQSQVMAGKIADHKVLEPAVRSLIERLKGLNAIENSRSDALACDEMREILQRADVDPQRLASEIEELVKPGWARRKFWRIFRYFDKKADIAIEAAASAATTRLLSGGP